MSSGRAEREIDSSEVSSLPGLFDLISPLSTATLDCCLPLAYFR